MTTDDKVRLCLLHNEVFESEAEAREHVKQMLCSAFPVRRDQVERIRATLSYGPSGELHKVLSRLY